MRLGVEPPDLARLEMDVAAFARSSLEPPVECVERDHDALGVVVWARPLTGLVLVLEDADALVLEDDDVLVWIGRGGIGHGAQSRPGPEVASARGLVYGEPAVPPKLMVRALFLVTLLAVGIDLLTGAWYLGMVAAVIAWAVFVLLYRLKLRRDAQRVVEPK
jgi:hypothetical protein